MKASVRTTICVVALSSMFGCTTMSESDYSARYVSVIGPGGRIAYVPSTCLADAKARPGGYLPPGCANALNLQGMVVDQRDLLHGQEMGPAFVAPAAAAVERYLGVVPDEGAQARQEHLITESGVSD